MNNGSIDISSAERSNSSINRPAKSASNQDELTRLKHELMRAEVRLAKARATAIGSEIDIKVLNARLKALTP